MVSRLFNKLKKLKILKKWSHFEVILRNYLGFRSEITSRQDSMALAMEWLCHAQDVTNCGGVSASYSLTKGWREPYPETTGYIIQSFIKYYHHTNKSDYLDRAIQMGNWEIEIQLTNGAVRGGVGHNENPIVFNTGQVILGWVDLYIETKQERFKLAAERASDWLLEIQDNDGKWSKYAYLDIPHSYHTEVSWGILEVYKISGNKKYLNAAKKQILWTLSNAHENGWFEQMAFTKERLPITHTIGYTLQGLLESAKFFDINLKENILEIVYKACVNIMNQYNGREDSQFLQASFDENWSSLSKYSCLTGSCQIAICFIEIYKFKNDIKLRDTAIKIIDQVKSTQNLNSKNKGIQGGIQGSYPIWGDYMPNNYPNWAAKYFVDALLLRELI
jgi:hypothetical protein